ncbi:hypothetical protein SCB49_12489 [unidentified eubacterium SCB49]|nr:hypothetical protein SCB49_12489 [unidentified eubacterium SCB49]
MQINDRISVLDDDISGVIIKIKNDWVTVLCDDGFEIDFNASQIVVMDNLLAKNVFSSASARQVLNEKVEKPKKQSQRIKPKERVKPSMEVDLHIHQLIPSEKGLTSHDKLNIQLDTAKRQLEFAISKKIQRVVFIHGVGEGVLKAELQYLFRRYDNVSYEDADYQKYGRGATMIFIRQN